MFGFRDVVGRKEQKRRENKKREAASLGCPSDVPTVPMAQKDATKSAAGRYVCTAVQWGSKTVLEEAVFGGQNLVN